MVQYAPLPPNTIRELNKLFKRKTIFFIGVLLPLLNEYIYMRRQLVNPRFNVIGVSGFRDI